MLAIMRLGALLEAFLGRRTRPRYGAGRLTGAFVALFVVACTTAVPPSASSVATGSPPPTASPLHGPGCPVDSETPLPAGMAIAAQFGSVVIDDMAYDSGRNVLWIPLLGGVAGSNANRLVAWSSAGQVGTWSLPDLNGGVSFHVRVGSDGAVWIATAYEVLRFDPANDHLAQASLPGLGGPARITAIGMVLGGGALIVRNDGADLTVLDASLKTVRTIAGPPGVIGSHDLAVTPDGTIYIASGGPGGDLGATVVALSPQGATLATYDVSADRLTVAGDRVLAGGGSSLSTWLKVGSPPETETGIPISGGMPVAPDPRGGIDAVLGPRVMHVANGTVVSELDIPTGVCTHAGYGAGVPYFDVQLILTDAQAVSWMEAGDILVRVTL
jgi:hypothetical protein